MSLIVPSSYERIQPIERGGDVADITRSVQDGDATVGWRGDASMDVYREGSVVKVYGFDRSGERYQAAAVHVASTDWRRTLLEKLRDGDWQSETSFAQKVMDAEDKRKADADSVKRDQISEIADKFVSARLRDENSRRLF